METDSGVLNTQQAEQNHERSRARPPSLALHAVVSLVCTASLFALGSACSNNGPLSPEQLPLAGNSATANLELVDSARMQVPENFPFKRFLCFGDSLTLGVTQRSPSLFGANVFTALTGVEGYPPKLARLMEAAYGEGITMVNAGIGGENTREGLERIDTEIRLHNPDIVLIVEGVVDINNEFPRFPIVRESLAEMMRIVQLRKRALVVGTVPRLNPDGFRTGGITHVPRLNDVIRQEAKGKNAPIADHDRAFPNDYSGLGPDGLHPNEKGYQIMAETWFERISEMLSEIGFEPATP